MRQIDEDSDMASQIATIYFNIFEYILHIFLHDLEAATRAAVPARSQSTAQANKYCGEAPQVIFFEIIGLIFKVCSDMVVICDH
jgi:hypothetical protein